MPRFVSGEEAWFELFAGAELFVVLGLAALSAAWLERSLVSPYLFLLGTLALFFGGRFLARLIGIDAPVFADDNFIPMTLSGKEAVGLMLAVSTTLLLIHLGYLASLQAFARGWLKPATDQAHAALVPGTVVLLVISGAAAGLGLYQNYLACMDLGYMGVYRDQGTDNLLRFASIGQYGLLIGLGLAFASGRRWLEAVALLLVSIYYTAYLGFGVRSGFIALALFIVWVVHVRVRRLGLASLAMIGGGLFLIAQLSLFYSCRDLGAQAVAEPKTAYQTQPKSSYGLTSLGWFLYLQGSTLVYTGAALRIEDYPATAVAQSLVPGFSQVWSRIDPKVPTADYYFPHVLARAYSAEKFEQGYGIGWSMVADIHAYAQRLPPLAWILPIVIGFGLASLSRLAASSALAAGALATIFMKLMMLPRAGLYSIIPYLLAYLILFAAAQAAARLWRAMRGDVPIGSR